MFKTFDLLSLAGLILAVISLVCIRFKIQPLWSFLLTIIGSFIFLAGQFLMAFYFKKVWGTGHRYLTGNDAYIGFAFWFIFISIAVLGVIKKYYNR